MTEPTTPMGDTMLVDHAQLVRVPHSTYVQRLVCIEAEAAARPSAHQHHPGHVASRARCPRPRTTGTLPLRRRQPRHGRLSPVLRVDRQRRTVQGGGRVLGRAVAEQERCAVPPEGWAHIEGKPPEERP